MKCVAAQQADAADEAGASEEASQLIRGVRQTILVDAGEPLRWASRTTQRARPPAAGYGLTGYGPDELRTNGRRATDRPAWGRRWRSKLGPCPVAIERATD
jgi:hypothetical protein